MTMSQRYRFENILLQLRMTYPDASKACKVVLMVLFVRGTKPTEIAAGARRFEREPLYFFP